MGARKPKRIIYAESESPMPFGGEYGWEAALAGRAATRANCHQCLSAGSTVGSYGVATDPWVYSDESPMPFGGEYGWETVRESKADEWVIVSPMPFGGEYGWELPSEA